MRMTEGLYNTSSTPIRGLDLCLEIPLKDSSDFRSIEAASFCSAWPRQPLLLIGILKSHSQILLGGHTLSLTLNLLSLTSVSIHTVVFESLPNSHLVIRSIPPLDLDSNRPISLTQTSSYPHCLHLTHISHIWLTTFWFPFIPPAIILIFLLYDCV